MQKERWIYKNPKQDFFLSIRTTAFNSNLLPIQRNRISVFYPNALMLYAINSKL